MGAPGAGADPFASLAAMMGGGMGGGMGGMGGLGGLGMFGMPGMGLGAPGGAGQGQGQGGQGGTGGMGGMGGFPGMGGFGGPMMQQVRLACFSITSTLSIVIKCRFQHSISTCQLLQVND